MTTVCMRGRAAKALRQAPENVQIAFSVWKEEVQQAGISGARAVASHPLDNGLS
jgi:hypothetical protein